MAMTYMNARCMDILHILMNADTYLTVQQIGDILHISKRSLYYDICRLNEWLDEYGIPELKVVRGKGILLDADMKARIESVMDDDQPEENYVLSPMERIHIIICSVIYLEKPTYIDQLVDFCSVSRNTIFNDLRVVVNQLQDYDLKLEYESKQGYRIVEDEIKIRAVYLMNIQEISGLYESGRLIFLDMKEIRHYLELLKQMEQELNVKYVDGVLLSLAALAPIMARGRAELYFPNLKEGQVQDTREWRLINKYFPEWNNKEKIYLCLHFLGARIAVDTGDIFEYHSNQMVYELTKALVSQFEKTACVLFRDREELERQLFGHINSSLYRYQYGIQVGDSLGRDIIREYPDLFELTKIVSRYMEQQIGLPIPDAEIAYLALHFGAHLSIPENNKSVLRILVVCANGVSTGNMLKREIQKLLPAAEIVKVADASGIQNAQEFCDVIVSTVRLRSVVPVIQVHPILTDYDRKLIINHPAVRESGGRADAERIFSQIEPYIREGDGGAGDPSEASGGGSGGNRMRRRSQGADGVSYPRPHPDFRRLLPLDAGTVGGGKASGHGSLHQEPVHRPDHFPDPVLWSLYVYYARSGAGACQAGGRSASSRRVYVHLQGGRGIFRFPYGIYRHCAGCRGSGKPSENPSGYCGYFFHTDADRGPEADVLPRKDTEIPAVGSERSGFRKHRLTERKGQVREPVLFCCARRRMFAAEYNRLHKAATIIGLPICAQGWYH